MSRRYWVSIIAFVGLIALTGVGSSNDAEIGNNADQKTEHVPASPSPPISSEDYSPYADRNADGCYDTKNHDSADLCAQWRAAIAAEKAANAATWGNIIAGIGAALSFISSVLVVIAIWQTRKANQISAKEYARSRVEAKNAATHSEAALAIAASTRDSDREIGEAQVRAYVTIVNPGIGFVGEFAHWKLRLINTGNSPAFEIKVSCDWGYSFYGQPVEMMPSDGSYTSISTLRTAQESKDIEISLGQRIDSEQPSTFDRKRLRTLLIWITVHIAYRDVFEKVVSFDNSYAAIVSGWPKDPTVVLHEVTLQNVPRAH